MLVFLYGHDEEKMKRELAARAEGGVVRISAREESADFLRELAAGASLFGGGESVYIGGVCSDAPLMSAVLDAAEDMVRSPRTFVISDVDAPKDFLSDVKKKGAEVVACEDKKKRREKRFNTFSLADAFAQNDRKKGWILYQSALSAGIPPEEICGVLFWQAKAIVLAKTYSSAAEAGLSAFAYAKARRAALADEKAAHALSFLLRAYHGARGYGAVPLGDALEEFILGGFSAPAGETELRR